MAKQIRNPKTIQKKSRSHEVSLLSRNRYAVTSGASGNQYTVSLVNGSGALCNCKWGQYRPGIGKSGCSHVVAVMDWIEAQKGRTVSAWVDPEQAKRQHRPAQTIGDGVVLTSRVK